MSSPVILYDNLFDDSTLLTASTTDPSSTEYNVLNLIDERQYTFWSSGTSTGVKYITIDTGASTSKANAIGIVGHNFEFAPSDGFTGSVHLQHSSDNFVTITTAIFEFGGTTFVSLGDIFVPAGDITETNFLFNITSAANRYWRLEISQTSSTPLKLAQVILGDKITIPSQETRNINPESHQVVSEGFESRALYPLGVDVRGSRFERTVEYTALPTTWLSQTFSSAWENYIGQSRPFMFSWNPLGLSTQFSPATAMYYVHVEPNSAFVSNFLDDTDYRTLTMKIRGKYKK